MTSNIATGSTKQVNAYVQGDTAINKSY